MALWSQLGVKHWEAVVSLICLTASYGAGSALCVSAQNPWFHWFSPGLLHWNWNLALV